MTEPGALMVDMRDSLDVRPRRSVRAGLFWLLRQRFPFTAIAPGSPAAPDLGFPNDGVAPVWWTVQALSASVGFALALSYSMGDLYPRAE